VSVVDSLATPLSEVARCGSDDIDLSTPNPLCWYNASHVRTHTALRRPADITQLGVLDLGALAESLIFYTRTSLILDAGSVEDLLRAIGAQNLNRLARSDAVDIVYMPDMTTVPNAGALPAAGGGLVRLSFLAGRQTSAYPNSS
jgi:hypothetical protein